MSLSPNLLNLFSSLRLTSNLSFLLLFLHHFSVLCLNLSTLNNKGRIVIFCN